MNIETKKIFSSIVLIFLCGILLYININSYLKTSSICILLYIYLRYIFDLETDGVLKKYYENELPKKIKEIMILDTYNDLPDVNSIPNHKKFYISETKQFYINIAGNYIPTNMADEGDFIKYLHNNYVNKNIIRFKYILRYLLLLISIVSFMIYFIIKVWRLL